MFYKMKEFINDLWDDLWYEYSESHNIVYGKNYKSPKKFRKQRLFNIIMIVIFISLFILYLKK